MFVLKLLIEKGEYSFVQWYMEKIFSFFYKKKSHMDTPSSLKYTGCSLNIVCNFSRILESIPPLPRQHSAAIVCAKKKIQPIGVTVHSHRVESFDGLLQRCRRRRGCSELWKKHIFSWTPCTWSVEMLMGKIVLLLFYRVI